MVANKKTGHEVANVSFFFTHQCASEWCASFDTRSPNAKETSAHSESPRRVDEAKRRLRGTTISVVIVGEDAGNSRKSTIGNWDTVDIHSRPLSADATTVFTHEALFTAGRVAAGKE